MAAYLQAVAHRLVAGRGVKGERCAEGERNGRELNRGRRAGGATRPELDVPERQGEGCCVNGIIKRKDIVVAWGRVI